MPTVSLRAHTGLQSKRYVNGPLDLGEQYQDVEVTDEVAGILREFSSGRIVAAPSQENIAELGAIGLTVDDGGAITSLNEDEPVPKSSEKVALPGRNRMAASDATPAQTHLPTPAEPHSHTPRRGR